MAISVIITSFNDQENIKEAVESAKLLSPHVVVYDLESSDKTVSLAQRAGAHVTKIKRVEYVELIREETIKKTSGDWVFLLDTDERITLELAAEIKKTIKSKQYSYYKIPRKNIFARKKWLKHGGWWPDYQTRLIKRTAFKSWPKVIHSTPQIGGPVGFLHKPFLHYFHGDLEQMVNKTIRFEDIESDLLLKANRPVNTPTFFRKYFGELWRRMFRNLGFLDGPVGIIESMYQAFSKTITWLFLYEKKRKSRSL